MHTHHQAYEAVLIFAPGFLGVMYFILIAFLVRELRSETQKKVTSTPVS